MLTYEKLGTCEHIYGDFKQGFATIVKTPEGYSIDGCGYRIEEATHPATPALNRWWEDMKATAACNGLVAVLEPITTPVMEFSEETKALIANAVLARESDLVGVSA